MSILSPQDAVLLSSIREDKVSLEPGLPGESGLACRGTLFKNQK